MSTNHTTMCHMGQSATGCGGEKKPQESTMAQAQDYYKKRGKLMYVLRQTYDCKWCPLTVVTRKIGLASYQEILKWERQAHVTEKRLTWNCEAVRALTSEERQTLKREAVEAMAEAAIQAEMEKQEAEADREYSALRSLSGPNRSTGTDAPSYPCKVECKEEPTASSSKEPLYKVDVESDGSSTVSDNVSVELAGNDDDDDCKIVGEKMAKLKPRQARMRQEPEAPWRQNRKEPEFEMESLAPLKRKRQSD